MAEMINIKLKGSEAEPQRTSRGAFEALWRDKGFIEVGDDGKPTKSKAVGDMTIPELRDYAAGQDIALPPEATKRDEILAAVTAALEG